MEDWTWSTYFVWSFGFAIAAVITRFRHRAHLKERNDLYGAALDANTIIKIADWAIGRFVYRVGRDLYGTLAFMGLLLWAWYAIFPEGVWE